MSSLRPLVVTTWAVASLCLMSCGRTESLILATGPDTGAETWSYEDTSEPPPPDMTTADTVSDDPTAEESDDWMTGDWGDEAVETWGEEDTLDWGEETFDWGEETVDWGETTDTATDTTSTDTTSTDTTSTDTTSTDTTSTDTSTDTTSTDTSTSTTTSTDTGGDTCADAAACLVDCGDFSQMCIDDCTSELDQMESQTLFSLQICAIQSCFFAGDCPINNFNDPACIQCRLEVTEDPAGFGCGPEGQACGI